MNDVKILVYLLDNKTEQFTINHISKILNMNYRIAHTEVKALEKEGLIQTEKVGTSLLCSLTDKFNEKIFYAEFQRRERLPKDIKQIQKRFGAANQNYILLLFGSFAKRKQTKHSDIDLLAVTENEKELRDISDFIPRDIHLTTVSYDSFIRMAKSKELSVVTEAIKNNIIMLGVEDYYRLLENAR